MSKIKEVDLPSCHERLGKQNNTARCTGMNCNICYQCGFYCRTFDISEWDKIIY